MQGNGSRYDCIQEVEIHHTTKCYCSLAKEGPLILVHHLPTPEFRSELSHLNTLYLNSDWLHKYNIITNCYWSRDITKSVAVMISNNILQVQ